MDPGDAPAGAGRRRVFVGRDRELGELTAGLDDALAGRGGCILITGDPGIGKTRLASELCDQAVQRGARPLWGRCAEDGSTPAYWPWVQILRALLRTGAVARDNPCLADLAVSLPELRPVLPQQRPAPRLEPEQARFRLLDSTAMLLEEASSVVPMVLVFDDIHAADESSLRLLHFVARELQHARLLLLCTYREAALRVSPAQAVVTGELARESRRIVLGGLGLDDATRCIEILAGARPHESVVADIHRITEGNPFYLDEFVRLLRADDRLQRASAPGDEALPIPEQVREAIRRRLRPLSAPTLRVLATAAVLGRVFDRHVLAGLCSAEAASQAIAEAQRASVVEAAPDGDMAFAHALIGETLYDDLDAAERARLHGLAGEILAARSTTEPGRLHQAARHFGLAAAPLDASVASVRRAIESHRAAAAAAVAQLAYHEAERHYEAALELLDRDLAAPMPTRCDVLVDLGDAAWGAGDLAAWAAHYRHAVAAARSLADADLVDGPERLARAALGLAGRQQRAHVAFEPDVVDVIEEALRRLGARAPALRARLKARLAYAIYSIPDSLERRQQLCEEAIAEARAVGDLATLAQVLNDTRWAQWAPETIEERLRTASELITLAERMGDRERAIGEHAWRVVDLFELGDRSGSVAELRIYSAQAAELRLPWYDWYVARFRAMFAVVEGRFADAEELATSGLRAAQRVQHGDAFLVFGVLLLNLRALQGRLDEVEPGLQSFAAQYPRLPVWGYAIAWAHAQQGRLDAAQAELDRVAVNELLDLPRDYMRLAAIAFLSEVCNAVGDARRAALLYDMLAPYADRSIIVGYGIAGLGSAQRYLGLLAATTGRRAAAVAHLEAAIEVNQRLHAEPFLALTRHDLARVLLQGEVTTSERQRADELRAAARQQAERLGMVDLLRRLDSGREATAVDVVAAPVTPRAALRREGDFWTFAHAGRTFRLKHLRGLVYIELLLRHPGRPFHVSELSELADGGTPGAVRFTMGDAGEVLDPQAKAAYRRRLEALRARQAEAEASNDLATLSAARAEIDQLAQQLAGAVGLGGRDRRAAATAERIRVAVTKAIGVAQRRIREHDEGLAQYLAMTIRTGAYCEFTPAPHGIAFEL